jgi:hypothetical protein
MTIWRWRLRWRRGGPGRFEVRGLCAGVVGEGETRGELACSGGELRGNSVEAVCAAEGVPGSNGRGAVAETATIQLDTTLEGWHHPPTPYCPGNATYSLAGVRTGSIGVP